MIPACYRAAVDNNMSHKVIFNDRWIGTNNASSSWGVVFSTIFEFSFGSWPNLFFMGRKTQNGGGFVRKTKHLDTTNLNQRFPSKWCPLISYDEITLCSWVFYLRTLHISKTMVAAIKDMSFWVMFHGRMRPCFVGKMNDRNVPYWQN